MQNRANPPAAGSPTVAGSVEDSVVAPSVASTDPQPPPLGQTPPNGDGSLARQRDEAYERMLEAIDALRGAQAEQAAARARVIELEHQVHIYLAENEHLRSGPARRGRDQARRRLAAAVRSLRPVR